MSVRHWFLILLTAALFGSSFFFVKIAVTDLPPMTIAAGRALLAAVVIVGSVNATGSRMPAIGPAWGPVLMVGLLTAAIPYAAIAVGQQHIESALGGVLFATIPLFTVLLAPYFIEQDTLTVQKAAGALAGLAGVVLILGPSSFAGTWVELQGAALTLFAAASYALGGIVTRRHAVLPPQVMAAGQISVASLLLGIASAGLDSPWTLTPSPVALGALIATGLLCTAAPVLLFFKLIREVGPARTSLLTFFMPFFSLMLGTLGLGERFGWQVYAGLVLIIAGAVLIARQPKPETAMQALADR